MTKSRTTFVLRRKPATTAKNFEESRKRAFRITHGIGWIFTIPILAPLTDVAVHIIQTPDIRQLHTNFMGFIMVVSIIPPEIIQIGASVGRGGSCATSVFPFCLGRKTRTQTLHAAVHNLQKLHTIIERYAIHRN